MERPLVERVDLGLLGEAEDLERGGVAQVRLLERGCRVLLVGRELVPADGVAVAGGRPAGLAVGALLAALRSSGATPSRTSVIGPSSSAARRRRMCLERGLPGAELGFEGLAPASRRRRRIRPA